MTRDKALNDQWRVTRLLTVSGVAMSVEMDANKDELRVQLVRANLRERQWFAAQCASTPLEAGSMQPLQASNQRGTSCYFPTTIRLLKSTTHCEADR